MGVGKLLIGTHTHTHSKCEGRSMGKSSDVDRHEVFEVVLADMERHRDVSEGEADTIAFQPLNDTTLLIEIRNTKGEPRAIFVSMVAFTKMLPALGVRVK